MYVIIKVLRRLYFSGMPVVIIVIYILVTQLGINWEFTEAYADVHSNGDM